MMEKRTKKGESWFKGEFPNLLEAEQDRTVHSECAAKSEEEIPKKVQRGWIRERP